METSSGCYAFLLDFQLCAICFNIYASIFLGPFIAVIDTQVARIDGHGMDYWQVLLSCTTIRREHWSQFSFFIMYLSRSLIPLIKLNDRLG